MTPMLWLARGATDFRERHETEIENARPVPLALGSPLCQFLPSAYPGGMATMNISLPTLLKAFVDSQVGSRGFGSSSDYIRDLIRKDKDRATLRELLLAGASSPVSDPVDAGYFQELAERARRQNG